MGLPLSETVNRAFKPKSRERWVVSTRPSAPQGLLSPLTANHDSARVAPKHCPILCTSTLILTFLAGGMFFFVNF